MAQQNKQNKKVPKIKFKIYWIYLGLLVILAFMMFNGGDSTTSKEINEQKLRSVLVKKDYEKINVVNKEFAEIYIKQSQIQNDTTYNDLKPKGTFGSTNQSYNGFYIFKFVDYDKLKIYNKLSLKNLSKDRMYIIFIIYYLRLIFSKLKKKIIWKGFCYG